MNRKDKLAKQAIKDALLDLLEERPLKSISVRLLCQTADVNRSSFYAHYQNIFDLLDEMDEDYLSHMVLFNTFDGNHEDYKRRLTVYVQYLKENRRFFLLMLKNNRLLSKILERSSQTDFQPHRSQIYSVLVIYSVCGSVSAVAEWLKHPDILSDQEIVQVLYDCACAIAKAGEQSLTSD